MDRTRRWDGLVAAVLRLGARLSGGRRLVWQPGADGAPPADPGSELRLARDVIERLDTRLEGLILRGPAQSRPDWEQAVRKADAASRTAWSRWADLVFDGQP